MKMCLKKPTAVKIGQNCPVLFFTVASDIKLPEKRSVSNEMVADS